MSNFAIYTAAVGKIISFFEIIKSDTYLLRHEDLISAQRFLKNAQRANNQTYFESNIDKAYYDFMHATTLVSNEELVCAWCGVALCQFIMGDVIGSEESILSANNVTLTISRHIRDTTERSITHVAFGLFIDIINRSTTTSTFPLNPFPMPNMPNIPEVVSDEWKERTKLFTSNKELIIQETKKIMTN